MPLGKRMPGLGIEQILDKSLPGAFLLRTEGAEKRLPLDRPAEPMRQAVTQALAAWGTLLDTAALGEHAHVAALVGTDDAERNPAVVLVRFHAEQIEIRAFAKEGMRKRHSAARAVEALARQLGGGQTGRRNEG